MPFQFVKAACVHPRKSRHLSLIGDDVTVAADAMPIAASREEDEQRQGGKENLRFHELFIVEMQRLRFWMQESSR